MLLLDRTPAYIWRLLLPKQNILFPENRDDEDLIFHYRGFVYFVHEDGAVIRMKKPQNVHKLQPEDMWELLFHDHDTFDYDDHGMFSIGSILIHMGFLIPMQTNLHYQGYEVEVINKLSPDPQVYQYTLPAVSFRYALYFSLLRCYELSLQDEDGEFEVQSITLLDYDTKEITPPSSLG
ncbi:hypothetical protein [Ammoniphilus sp. YIM 78166]|uniref:hypothetical protein n=1 Tax=Ammoniphilus sp. YIM 78166 TaxID=1644106 RepID=UPI00106FADB7|nr:hypothetical protein [Ammoniphilus sp. YIM 78166]